MGLPVPTAPIPVSEDVSHLLHCADGLDALSVDVAHGQRLQLTRHVVERGIRVLNVFHRRSAAPKSSSN
jgi:hypothetical protein